MKTPPECDIQEFLVRLSEVLGVTATTPRCGVPFLNLSFAVKSLAGNVFSPIGLGVYGLFFTPPDGEKERLIYAGMYRGPKKAPFGGHIVKDRWWTHAASVTMRGHRISIAKRTSSQLVGLLSFSSPHDFQHLAVPANPLCLHKDNGCAAGINRVLFAKTHWDFFGSANEANILAPFRIVYLRLGSKPPGMDGDTLRAEINQIEQRLIAALLPVCNDETKWGTARYDVSMEMFIPDVQRQLCHLWRRFG